MSKYIDEFVKLLEANDATETSVQHRSFVQKKLMEIECQAESRGCPKEIASSVLGYIINHHYFDLDSQTKAGIIIDAVFELICPVAMDDERSFEYIQNLNRRLSQ